MSLSEGLSSAQLWEACAVLLGVTYLLLAMRENLWCWAAAFFSTLIYLFLFWHVSLLMESALQLYYLVMAVYGWWHWRGGAHKATAVLPISSWPASRHLLAICAVLLLSLLSGFLLAQYSEARLPYLDSFTTWGSILTTWMVARKVLENWLYWIVIDSVSLYLYLDRALYFTAALFAAYLVIVVFGYFQWRTHYREQHAETVAARTG
jgi:nicotinamide mononucleotide transporter